MPDDLPEIDQKPNYLTSRTNKSKRLGDPFEGEQRDKFPTLSEEIQNTLLQNGKNIVMQLKSKKYVNKRKSIRLGRKKNTVSNLRKLALYIEVNGKMKSQTVLAKVFIQMADTMKGFSLMVCHMVMGDLLMKMVTIMKEKSSSEEEMDMESIRLQKESIEVSLKITF